MNGRKARSIRKAQLACDHVKEAGRTRHAATVQFDRCASCGVKFGSLIQADRQSTVRAARTDPRREAFNKAKGAADIRADQRKLDRARRRRDLSRGRRELRWGIKGSPKGLNRYARSAHG